MGSRQVIEKFWRYIVEGNFPQAFAMFVESGSYTVQGKTPVSREFAPKSAIEGEFIEIIGSLFVNGPPTFTTRDIIVDGNRGVIIASGICDGAYGVYDQSYCFYGVTDNENIKSVVEHVDSLPVEIALMGGKLVRKDGTVVS